MTADLWALADRPPPPVIPGQLAVPDGPAIGSLCTGYGGLDMAVQQVLSGHLAWVADPDPGATAILTHHHPDVPNLGDITVTDWATVPPVDVLCGGYPCQPFSVAGLRKGTADERHIWPYIATALRVLRPRLAIFENVAGHLRLGFADVLADLAALGFDAEWVVVSASDVGAPHQRKRLWLLAWPADTGRPGLARGWAARAATNGRDAAADPAHLGHQRVGRPWGRGLGPADDGDAPTDTAGPRRREGHAGTDVQPVEPGANRVPAPDSDRDPVRQQPVAEPRRDSPPVAELARAHAAADAPSAGRCEGRGIADTGDGTASAQGAGEPARSGSERVPEWGRFAPAVHRWEAATGRTAPWATDPRGRLSPLFVEWMMGLPAGHVTGVPGLSRTRQLKALGNGVVPQQATAALRLLLARTPATR